MERRAQFDAITRALRLREVAVPAGATVRRGTLVVDEPASGTRTRAPRVEDDELAILPRVDVTESSDTGAEITLGELLGAGGMGAVFLARQRSLRRDVAVKRLRAGSPSGGTDDARHAAALLAEARIAGALEHPSIVPVHVLGVDEQGSPLLVMKRIEGATLEQLLRDGAHPAWAELERRHGDRLGAQCEILMRVADALHFAHSRGVVHRDVKPANVMVGSFGEVYVVDWGVALQQHDASDEAHEIVGTPAFMAPEMVRADATLVDARTDVYLLGATLHAVLVGANRHRGDSSAQILLAAFLSEPFEYDTSVPEELAVLANACTSVEPDARPSSARAFRDALADFLRHRGSLRLAETAESKLEAMRVATGGSAAMLARPETFAELVECRFALAQALGEWGNNQRARRALRTTLTWMVEAELERRSADGAATVARALDPRDPALEARIDALRADLEEARQLEQEGRAERQERELESTSRYRVPITLGIIALCVVTFGLALAREHVSARPVPMDRVVRVDVAMLGIMASTLWVFRRRLLKNRLTKQLASLLLLSLGASTIADQIHASRGETSMEAGALSVMMVGAVFLGAAIGIGGRLWWAAGVCFAAGIVAAIWPATSTLMVGVGCVGCLIALIYDALGARSRVSL
ncbi:protein kinase domain-containing protein [Sandaracinus amylolyticus]|uniref:Serine/threonine protein kinase n=1 Tax=Sandaracinus amylolyticus TaxID=927083 RepID=A0A0F6W1Y5_9BACT|nr:protein kinase [Sandaracinus amylolyticus]AKF05202.1 serine/threonine protein kinase [Sandaracinus amylolyticus]